MGWQIGEKVEIRDHRRWLLGEVAEVKGSKVTVSFAGVTGVQRRRTVSVEPIQCCGMEFEPLVRKAGAP